MTTQNATSRRKTPDVGASRLRLSFEEFLRQPRLVGSGFPASRILVDELLAPVDWDAVHLVVEYGPGTGPLTRALLARMPRGARLVAIDVSDRFTKYLRRTIADPRLTAVTGSAEFAADMVDHIGLGEADMIVTGIPFSTMAPDQATAIMERSVAMLHAQGAFLAYQMRSTIAPFLHDRFNAVRKSYVWRNIPPCHLYWAKEPIAA